MAPTGSLQPRGAACHRVRSPKPRPGGTDVVNLDGSGNRRRSDRELADAALMAAKHLQDAMDAAIMAGLIVEPTAKMVENRFVGVGVSSDSYPYEPQRMAEARLSPVSAD